MNTAKARGPESPRDRQFKEVPDPVLPPWALGELWPSDKAGLREKHRHGFQQ